MAVQLKPTSTSVYNSLGFSESSVLAPIVFQRRISQQSTNAGAGFSSGHKKQWRRVLCMKNGDRTPPTAEASPLVKLAWYGSEAFGNAVSIFRPKSTEGQAADDGELKFDGPVDRGTVVDLIKKDYDRSYFVTGYMATGIYEEDCEFADPFVSFKGLNRFKQNVGNLGSFMEESTLKLTDWQEYEDRIYARWRFSCVLALPWRPILAVKSVNVVERVLWMAIRLVRCLFCSRQYLILTNCRATFSTVDETRGHVNSVLRV